MRTVESKKITKTIKDLCIKANYEISDDVLLALNEAHKKERSETGKQLLLDLIRNAEIARKDGYPICQDTGIAIVHIELGQDVKIKSGNINEAINEGVIQGYNKGYLRKSIVKDPFIRKNTKNNAPAMIHCKLVPGKNIKITFMAKGGGSENKSAFKMFKPTSSKDDVINFVIDTVKIAGGEACPPFIIGIGIGGNLEKSALLAKKALFRKVGQNNQEHDMAAMENQILKKINKTGIGPGGLGGKITALSVAIEKAPCHIASLPVTVNIDCHAHRVKEAVI